MSNRFRKHVAQILGTTVGLSVGCGGAAREERMRKDLTDNICPEGFGSGATIQGLSPASPVDALAWRSLPWFPMTKPDDQSDEEWAAYLKSQIEQGISEMRVVETAGACSEVAACPEQPLPEEPGLSYGAFSQVPPDNYHLVAYRGDEAQLYYSADEVRAFLGTIDTPEEAKLLLLFDGYRMDCDGDDNYKKEGDDYVFYVETGHTCGSNVKGHLVRVSADGTLKTQETHVVEKGDKNCVVGRLPAGQLLDAERAIGRMQAQGAGSTSEPARVGAADQAIMRAMGEYFAQNAYLEAASIAAFEELADELQELSASARLVNWARRAAREERRHTLHCRALARKFGAAVQVPTLRRAERRSVLQIALDNAREGLTREAFGALLAEHQTRRAKDPEVRAVMSSIADDEMSHAEFSLALHAELMHRLSPAERALVEGARRAAVEDLSVQPMGDVLDDPALCAVLGLPPRAAAQEMFQQLFSATEIFQA